MKQFIFFVVILSVGFIAGAQPCVSIVAPQLSENSKKEFEQKLALAKAVYEKDTNDADAIIWYGRRTAYLGDYLKAIEIFSKGINSHPGDARLYRHRGHRYLTVRCFDKSIADFKKAAKLIKGKPDETEPDGLPNAKNIPTSTLQSNTWYHLGLTYFIKGENKKALKAYKECLKVADNADMYVATANWMNITLRKMGKEKEAVTLCNSIDKNAELIESRDYMNILDMYRSKLSAKEIDSYAMTLSPKDQSLASATINFGIGYYCLLFGYKEKAMEFLKKAIATNQWSSFGFIAAETALKNMK